MSKAVDQSKKRKGATEPSVTTKKVKTTTVEKPALKSALKKTDSVKGKKETKAEETPAAVAATKTAKPARKRAEDFLESAEKPAKKTTTVKVQPGKVTKTTVIETGDKSAVSKVTKSKAAKKEEIVPEESDSEEEAEDDQTAALLAGFESDEDENDPQDEGMALEKIPAAPTSKELKKQLKAAEADPESTPGVIYVGRIPHGFYESQMKEYFSQFGDITHLRMARNKLTGRSKHYAFVEFSAAAVADIVAKTMDKYLLFGHLLQVRRVPAEQVHEKLWKGEGRRFKVMPRNKIEGGMLKRGATREGWEKRVQRETRSRTKKADQLKEMGYEFDMPALKSVQDVPTQEAREAEAAPLVGEASVKAVLDKDAQESTPKAESKKEAPAEKAGTKRAKAKGDGKKTAKKARVST